MSTVHGRICMLPGPRAYLYVTWQYVVIAVYIRSSDIIYSIISYLFVSISNDTVLFQISYAYTMELIFRVLLTYLYFHPSHTSCSFHSFNEYYRHSGKNSYFTMGVAMFCGMCVIAIQHNY